MRFPLVAVASLLLVLDTSAQARRRRAVRSPSSPPVVVARTVVLVPSKDNTLFRTPDGSRSNGAGIHLFAGATASREPRRALLAFDLAQIPPGSEITRVVLTLQVTKSISGTHPMTLHRVATNWGEGASNAGSLRDGIGGVAVPGDATWIHTVFPDQRWTTEGGDFDATADAAAVATFGAVTWESAAMIARVQQWVDQPSTNFGWILIGDETRSTTAKQLDSREASEETRPMLTVEFNSRPQARSNPAL